MKTILVTGAAGFIGFHTAKQLCERGDRVIGIDNLNEYYDLNLKLARLELLKKYPHFHFIKCDLVDLPALEKIFHDNTFDCVVNLAAQAGVRYSLENPHVYMQSNIVGFCNILECCRKFKIAHLVFASSSSVYGANAKQPFSEHDSTEHPVSLYAASKKSNEMLAHSYAHLYGIPVTGLRFFTVYGPWGRPDMALFKFTKNILNDEPIEIYNHGEMVRDFTYIDDIVDGVVRVIDHPATSNLQWNGLLPDPATSSAPYQIYNIGNSKPVRLLDFIDVLEKCLQKKAVRKFSTMQMGDVVATHSDTSNLAKQFGYVSKTSVESGIRHFLTWYTKYYSLPLNV